MSAPHILLAETDPRFPSGRWQGFFIDARLPGKHMMELHLHFFEGIMRGRGRDRVGDFSVEGTYECEDGVCTWTKHYLAAHDVLYHGFNEGKGIWGRWELTFSGIRATGGFHIWPEGMPDPTLLRLHEEVPIPDEQVMPTSEPMFAPVG